MIPFNDESNLAAVLVFRQLIWRNQGKLTNMGLLPAMYDSWVRVNNTGLASSSAIRSHKIQYDAQKRAERFMITHNNPGAI